jgi:predicted transcriptional regulator
MKVKDIMRTDFWYFTADDNLEYMIKTFSKLDMYEAPVVSQGEFIGLVSDKEIAGALLQKGLFSFFSKKKIIDSSKLTKITASKIANRRSLTLNEEEPLVDILEDLAKRRSDIIPVLRNRKLIGIVDGEDVMRHLSLEVAKESISDEFAPAELKSIVDSVAAIVREKKKVSADEIGKKLGIPVPKVEKIARSLEEHHLAEITYSLLGRMILRERNV